MDIQIQSTNQRFKYRAAGIIIMNNHILLQNIKDYWAPPGGKIMMMEDSLAGLKRELKEELSADVEVIQSLWFLEQFYHHGEREFHELAMFYLCQSEELWDRGLQFTGIENGEEMTYQWFDLKDVKDINLQPSLLKEKLFSLPANIEHIIERN